MELDERGLFDGSCDYTANFLNTYYLLLQKVGLQSKSVPQLKEYYQDLKAFCAALVAHGSTKGRRLADSEADERLRARHTYCVCESRAGSGETMMCGTCLHWFHSLCVSSPSADVRI